MTVGYIGASGLMGHGMAKTCWTLAPPWPTTWRPWAQVTTSWWVLLKLHLPRLSPFSSAVQKTFSMLANPADGRGGSPVA